MSFSSITPASAAPVTPTPQPKKAADGDSAAQEAAESSATKLAEKNNGGYAPKATSPVTSTTSTSGNQINKIA